MNGWLIALLVTQSVLLAYALFRIHRLQCEIYRVDEYLRNRISRVALRIYRTFGNHNMKMEETPE